MSILGCAPTSPGCSDRRRPFVDGAGSTVAGGHPVGTRSAVEAAAAAQDHHPVAEQPTAALADKMLSRVNILQSRDLIAPGKLSGSYS